jgi:hypothetical protein
MRATVNNPSSDSGGLTYVWDGPSNVGTRFLGAIQKGAQIDVVPQPDGWAHVTATLAGLPLQDGNLKQVVPHINQRNLVFEHPSPGFAISPASVPAGQPFTLRWSIREIQGVWITHPDGKTYGTTGQGIDGSAHSETLTLASAGTYTYTLAVKYADGARVSYPQTVTVTPITNPSPTTAPLIGINAYGDMRVAVETAINLGCRVFCVTHNEDAAIRYKIARPDLWFVMRPFLYNGRMPLQPDEIPNRLKIDETRGLNMIYVALNENDQIGCDETALRTRAAFDVALAQQIKATNPQAIYAAGSFSMGTPDYTKQSVCDVIREVYAPHYNSGLIWWDNHLYSPTMQHIYDDAGLQWYERRWEFLFTKCGFNPNSSSRIIATETGVDEGGVGGFPQHNATSEQVVAWCQRFVEISARPVVVNGVSYPSPFLFGTLFAAGNSPSWRGYEVSGYYPALDGTLWA